MSTVEIKVLQRYRIDRHVGMTADGGTQLVVLVLKPLGDREVAVAVSKVDAMIIAHQLIDAAQDAQATQA